MFSVRDHASLETKHLFNNLQINDNCDFKDLQIIFLTAIQYKDQLEITNFRINTDRFTKLSRGEAGKIYKLFTKFCTSSLFNNRELIRILDYLEKNDVADEDLSRIFTLLATFDIKFRTFEAFNFLKTVNYYLKMNWLPIAHLLEEPGHFHEWISGISEEKLSESVSVLLLRMKSYLYLPFISDEEKASLESALNAALQDPGLTNEVMTFLRKFSEDEYLYILSNFNAFSDAELLDIFHYTIELAILQNNDEGRDDSYKIFFELTEVHRSDRAAVVQLAHEVLKINPTRDIPSLISRLHSLHPNNRKDLSIIDQEILTIPLSIRKRVEELAQNFSIKGKIGLSTSYMFCTLSLNPEKLLNLVIPFIEETGITDNIRGICIILETLPENERNYILEICKPLFLSKKDKNFHPLLAYLSNLPPNERGQFVKHIFYFFHVLNADDFRDLCVALAPYTMREIEIYLSIFRYHLEESEGKTIKVCIHILQSLIQIDFEDREDCFNRVLNFVDFIPNLSSVSNLLRSFSCANSKDRYLIFDLLQKNKEHINQSDSLDTICWLLNTLGERIRPVFETALFIKKSSNSTLTNAIRELLVLSKGDLDRVVYLVQMFKLAGTAEKGIVRAAQLIPAYKYERSDVKNFISAFLRSRDIVEVVLAMYEIENLDVLTEIASLFNNLEVEDQGKLLLAYAKISPDEREEFRKFLISTSIVRAHSIRPDIVINLFRLNDAKRNLTFEVMDLFTYEEIKERSDEFFQNMLLIDETTLKLFIEKKDELASLEDFIKMECLRFTTDKSYPGCFSKILDNLVLLKELENIDNTYVLLTAFFEAPPGIYFELIKFISSTNTSLPTDFLTLFVNVPTDKARQAIVQLQFINEHELAETDDSLLIQMIVANPIPLRVLYKLFILFRDFNVKPYLKVLYSSKQEDLDCRLSEIELGEYVDENKSLSVIPSKTQWDHLVSCALKLNPNRDQIYGIIETLKILSVAECDLLIADAFELAQQSLDGTCDLMILEHLSKISHQNRISLQKEAAEFLKRFHLPEHRAEALTYLDQMSENHRLLVYQHISPLLPQLLQYEMLSCLSLLKDIPIENCEFIIQEAIRIKSKSPLFTDWNDLFLALMQIDKNELPGLYSIVSPSNLQKRGTFLLELKKTEPHERVNVAQAVTKFFAYNSVDSESLVLAFELFRSISREERNQMIGYCELFFHLSTDKIQLMKLLLEFKGSHRQKAAIMALSILNFHRRGNLDEVLAVLEIITLFNESILENTISLFHKFSRGMTNFQEILGLLEYLAHLNPDPVEILKLSMPNIHPDQTLQQRVGILNCISQELVILSPLREIIKVTEIVPMIALFETGTPYETILTFIKFCRGLNYSSEVKDLFVCFNALGESRNLLLDYCCKLIGPEVSVHRRLSLLECVKKFQSTEQRLNFLAECSSLKNQLKSKRMRFLKPLTTVSENDIVEIFQLYKKYPDLHHSSGDYVSRLFESLTYTLNCNPEKMIELILPCLAIIKKNPGIKENESLFDPTILTQLASLSLEERKNVIEITLRILGKEFCKRSFDIAVSVSANLVKNKRLEDILVYEDILSAIEDRLERARTFDTCAKLPIEMLKYFLSPPNKQLVLNFKNDLGKVLTILCNQTEIEGKALCSLIGKYDIQTLADLIQLEQMRHLFLQDPNLESDVDEFRKTYSMSGVRWIKTLIIYPSETRRQLLGSITKIMQTVKSSFSQTLLISFIDFLAKVHPDKLNQIIDNALRLSVSEPKFIQHLLLAYSRFDQHEFNHILSLQMEGNLLSHFAIALSYFEEEERGEVTRLALMRGDDRILWMQQLFTISPKTRQKLYQLSKTECLDVFPTCLQTKDDVKETHEYLESLLERIITNNNLPCVGIQLLKIISRNNNFLQVPNHSSLAGKIFDIYPIFFGQKPHLLHPYILFRDLQEQLVIQKNVSSVPFPATYNDKHVNLNLKSICSKAKAGSYTVASISKNIPADALESGLRHLTDRIALLSVEHQDKIKNYLKEAYGSPDLLSAINAFLKTGIMKSYLAYEGELTDPVDVLTYQLYAILQAWLDSSTQLTEGMLLSNREEMLIKICHSIMYCPTGVAEGITLYYNLLPLKYKQSADLALRKPEARVHALVNEAYQYFLDNEFSSCNWWSILFPNEPIMHANHQIRYLKNRLFKQMGYATNLMFDFYSQTIDKRLIQESFERLLFSFMASLRLENLLNSVKRFAAEGLENNTIGYMDLVYLIENEMGMGITAEQYPEFIEFDDMYKPLGLTLIGAMKVLLACEYVSFGTSNP